MVSDVLPLHHMDNLQNMLQDHQANIRTQISLTRSIKKAIEVKARILGESLSEYLRKAALIRLASEEEEERELKTLARNFVGGSSWNKNHTNWTTRKSVKEWKVKIRHEW